ncbi:enoyl-CoA hydratase/isomerase family protein [Scopulibacillus darangshiensis]|uniref:enoyl-CoA hydratase/isomerase family protein n=1 Tax=Scopulibacillus darangshiensis TaxID=442528 RepID=UPI00243668FE|nr:enoyl-CoA hydratase-related protein [Scopulibacillus darangshiensis]
MEELLASTHYGVRTLTLNRPECLNAINDTLSSQLQLALKDASSDDDVRVIVITGKGRGFCAGLDLKDRSARLPERKTRHKQLDELGWVGRQAISLIECDKPVIAAINGVAAGAGLALALACDLRFMSESAKVTTGYIRRGLSPDAGMCYFLPRLVGQTKAAEMIFTGCDILPNEAEQIGLVNKVFSDEEFDERVMTVAKELAEGPPIALTLSKRLFKASEEVDLTTLLKQELSSIKACFETKDAKEGIQAFVEKRKPLFKGE